MTSQATGLVTKMVWVDVTESNFTSMLRSGCPAVGIGVNVGNGKNGALLKSACSVGPYGPSATRNGASLPLTVSVDLSKLGKTIKKHLQLVRSTNSSAPTFGLLGPNIP